MATPNELSLIFGIVVSALFFIQYKRYEAQAEKEEMLDAFLDEQSSQSLTANA